MPNADKNRLCQLVVENDAVIAFCLGATATGGDDPPQFAGIVPFPGQVVLEVELPEQLVALPGAMALDLLSNREVLSMCADQDIVGLSKVFS